jgi:hypothetical protein
MPDSMFRKDNEISDKLNDFQNRYTRFIRCQDESTSGFVHPQCNATSDTFVNVQRSYQSLLTSMNDMEKALSTTQITNGTTNQQSAEDEEEILRTYAAIREQRKRLDQTLERLYSQRKAGPGSSEEQLKQSMYANTLWVILASCLIWYAVVEMR